MVVAAAAAEQDVKAASPWVYGDYGQIRLLSSSDGVDESQTVQIGIQMRLRKGWKTYWRTPGESGIPPHFDWSGSQNVVLSEPAWPTPTRLSEFGAEAFGYKQEVIFPFMATRKDLAGGIDLDLVMSFGVCLDICVPVTAQLTLSLPTKGDPVQRTQQARHIERFIAKVPGENGAEGLTIASLRLAGSQEKLAVEVNIDGTNPMSEPDAVLELGPEYRQLAPRIVRGKDSAQASVVIPIIMDGEATSLIGQNISVVVWDGDGLAVEGVLRVR